MKNEPLIKVSVIVPVYNTEKYLNKCLDSITNQTLKEIEIICIDDGSTDKSLQILGEYKENDDRFVLLNQNHKHAGCARNLGLSKAVGKYVIFWDSDDYFKPKALEEMYNQIVKDNADICVCCGRGYFEDEDFESPWPSYLKTKSITSELPFNIKTEPDNIISFTNSAIWNKMFRREFLLKKGVLFPDIRNIEDIFFTNCNLCLADSVTYINKQLIVYRRNTPNGAVSQISTQGKEVIDLWIKTAKYLQENKSFPKRSFANKCLQGILYTLENINGWEGFRETYYYLQEKLSELYITKEDNSYYYNVDYPVIIDKINTATPEEFIVFLKSYYYLKNTKSSAKRRRDNEKNKKKIKKLEKEKESLNSMIVENEKKYDKKIKTINGKLQESDQRLNELQNKLKKTNAQLTKSNILFDKINKELNTIKTSFSYKLARVLTFLPRKIKKIFGKL